MRFVNTLILGTLLAATAPGLLAQTTQPTEPREKVHGEKDGETSSEADGKTRRRPSGNGRRKQGRPPRSI
jgi:hypothetical protein